MEKPVTDPGVGHSKDINLEQSDDGLYNKGLVKEIEDLLTADSISRVNENCRKDTEPKAQNWMLRSQQNAVIKWGIKVIHNCFSEVD